MAMFLSSTMMTMPKQGLKSFSKWQNPREVLQRIMDVALLAAKAYEAQHGNMPTTGESLIHLVVVLVEIFWLPRFPNGHYQ